MGLRTFTCKECQNPWQTDLPGRFTTCPGCQEAQERARRARPCTYRNCGRVFTDVSPKNGVKYCSAQCAHREKMYRSGRALDESYFRDNKSQSVGRKCRQCGGRFEPTPEDGACVRCRPCREGNRAKRCEKCSDPFTDTSLKNTYKMCLRCSTVGVAQEVYVGGAARRPMDPSTMTPYTHSWWGRVGELLVLHLHPEFFDAVNAYGGASPYDLYHRDWGRIAVKTTAATMNPQGRLQWKFQLGADAPRCQWAFLIGLSTDRTQVERAWFLPFSRLPVHLRVMAPGSAEYDPEGEVSPVELQVMNRKLRVLLNETGPALVAAPRVLADHALVGRVGERLYGALYPGSKHVAGENPTAPYDFLDPDGTRVNVRTRRPNATGEWEFAVPRDTEADVFYFIALNAPAGTVQAAYRIPVSAVRSGALTACLGGGWAPYRSSEPPFQVASKVPLTEAERDQFFLSAPDVKSKPAGEVLPRALRYHRELGFPYPAIPTTEEFNRELESVRRYVAHGDEYPLTNAGLAALAPYFPHRYEAQNETSDFSAVGAFNDDARFLKALAYLFRRPDSGLTRGEVRSALTLLNRTPGQFPPGVARALVEQYCPRGGLVLDPCAGWGGRLVGTLVAGARYVGVELNRATADALAVLGDRVRGALGLPPEFVRIVHGRAEAFELEGPGADFALTSPPYWKRERYGAEPELLYEEWVADFLEPMFARVAAALGPGAFFAVNVTDYRDRGGAVPLEASAQAAAGKNGFVLQRVLKLHKGGRAGARGSEPIFLFRRG